MNFKEIFSAKRAVFLGLFVLLVLIGNRINFSAIVGQDSQFFTLYQFFGPIAGGFLGPLFGGIAVLLSQIADYIISGKAFTLINIIRLAPMVFAAVYFAVARKKGYSRYIMAIIPLICMAIFMLHPIAGQVWYYSLYWLIPVLGVVLPEKVPGKLLMRSFGATFTAHAIGTTAWLLTVPMTAAQWQALIPVVAFERFLFGIGIASSYVVMNVVLDLIVDKFKLEIPADVLHLDKRYVLVKKVG